MKIQKYLLPIIVGFLFGIFTLVGQKYLPNNLNFLANSASMWLIPAFLISYYSKADIKFSAIMSILSLVSSVMGYYIFEAFLNKHDFAVSKYIILWLGCALVGGLVFGLGANFSHTKKNFLKYAGMNLLPAVFISEGLDKVIHFSEYKHMIIGVILSIMIGIVLYFVINRNEAFRKNNLLSVICLVVLGITGFSLLSAF